MKFSFKKMAVGLLSLTLALSMIACNNAGNGGETGSSAPESSTPSQLMDFNYMTEDLSKYVTVGQYKGFTFSIPKKTEVTDDDVSEQIKYDLIGSKIVNQVTDRAVTKDDTVSISYKGFLGEVQFEGGTGDKDYFTVYDGGGFIDGFATGLVGVMPGVETDLNLKFPDSYHSADLAGKAVVFKVTVHHIYEAKELTDEVAAQLSGKDGMTADALRADYRAKLEERVDSYYENYKISLTWQKIMENAKEVELPKDLIDNYYEAEMTYYKAYASMYGMSLDAFLSASGLTEDSIYKNVRDSVFSEMVIFSIMKLENITISDDEFQERLNEYLKDSDYTKDELLKKYTKDELVEMFAHSKTLELGATWQNYTIKEDEESEPSFDFMGEDLTKYLVLGQYKDLKIELPTIPQVTDDEVLESINKSFMKAKICKKIKDRAVTKDDTVSIYYEGFIDGEQFVGGTGESDFFTVYNGGGFIPGFAEGIIGATPGTPVAVELTFPDNYYEELAGKEVTFMVTVNHIYVPAELNDQNAANLTGEEDMTVEKLLAECREMLEQSAEEKYNNEKAAAIFKAIVDAAEKVSPPEELVEDYYNSDVEYYEYYAGEYGMTYEEMLEYVGLTDETLRERAEANVMKDIAVYSIIKAENITVSDGEYDKYIGEMEENTGYSRKDLEELYTKEELTEQFTYSKAYEMIEGWQEIVIK